MPQETNLNTSPYFDDFQASKEYYKVLFKPGYPVQARELNNLQSILQNQIENFGEYFFKEGEKVIPGNTTYIRDYNCVELENIYIGVPINQYTNQLVGTKVTGRDSGVSGVVNKVVGSNLSERGSTVLYISYISSGNDNAAEKFFDGELLVCDTTLTSNNSIIAAGEPFASTVAVNAVSTGSAYAISNGVYFAKGTFLLVNEETIILDQFSNTPSYRIGLLITEELINSDIDPTLNDNSRGYTNYSAPGADRLKMTCALHKKDLDDFDDNDFVELATIRNGELRSLVVTPNNTEFQNLLAKRTYAESGDYYTKPFDTTIKESLNDYENSKGVFTIDQLTYGGSTPSPDLAVYRISPGRAFVKGYDIESDSIFYLDCPKPRTFKTVEGQAIEFNTGPSLFVNRVYGAPEVGFGNTYFVSLMDERIGSSDSSASGKEIGYARVYDFKLESGSYDANNADINEWGISLFDIQTTSDIELNENISLSVPTFVEGKRSGATAFLKDSVSVGKTLTVYQISGEFSQSEPFIFDGIPNNRVAVAITNHTVSDVKSIHGQFGSKIFNADVIQSVGTNIGFATITAESGGTSTVSAINPVFPTAAKVGDIVRYVNTTSSSPDQAFASVVDVGQDSLTISPVTTVNGVCDGTLPTSEISVSNFSIQTTNLERSYDNSLYTPFPKENIESVSLDESQITIRKEYTINISSNRMSTRIGAGPNSVFETFTPQRYLLVRSDGTTEVLTDDKMKFSNGFQNLDIENLGSNDTGATLITTVKKVVVKPKEKFKNRVNSVVIDKSNNSSSGIGTDTLNDGLIIGNYAYGTRVQDKLISLNVPDIIEVHAIYESLNFNDPSAPTCTLKNLTGVTATTRDIVPGERVYGSQSNSVAIVPEILSDSVVTFIPKNDFNFIEGETVTFAESNITGTINQINNQSVNITKNFTYSTGQKETFYDLGSIKRNDEAVAPSKKIKVYFTSAYYKESDDGDITIANSYAGFNYDTEIRSINEIRNTDILDVRPRVARYTPDEDIRSPFEFLSRQFNEDGQSAANIIASDETIFTDFNFYLGRIDRIFLSKDGSFIVKYGNPDEDPENPVSVDNAIEISRITLPPYLYNVEDVSIKFLDYKRYQMKDIKNLEDRIKNLEYYTSLSLLEVNTANLFVPDDVGLNRFKSGFFVDNFTTLLTQEDSITIKNSIDTRNKELRAKHFTTSIDLVPGPVENVDPDLDLQFLQPEGNGIRQGSGVITLDYTEEVWFEQVFGTRDESVTPYIVSFWTGVMELTPETDTWVDQVKAEPLVTDVEGDFTSTLLEQNADPQTGLSPIIWNSWQDNWTGSTSEDFTTRRVTNRTIGRRRIRTTTENTFRTTTDTGVSTRDGTRTLVTEQFDRQSLGERVINRSVISFMRSRNIQFVSKKNKPKTRLYPFFDGVDVSAYCTPKLLEISMISGSFKVGETVIGSMGEVGILPVDRPLEPAITFRVAQSNHKHGPYNAPTKLYTINPYDGKVMQSAYSSSSTILNVDTFSLSNQPQGNFSGWVAKGMKLVGQSSGATATISEVRFISDISATTIGSFFIPDPNASNAPQFETGDSVFRLINSSANDVSDAVTVSDGKFTSSGTLETVQENILSVRNAKVEIVNESEERAISRQNTQLVNTSITNQVTWVRRDPLAQSFFVSEPKGVFLTKCDVFFSKKDKNSIPLIFQLRTMSNGVPTEKVLPLSEVIVDPEDIVLSNDGSIPTSIELQAPVYLEGGTEYAVVMLSDSAEYRVYISRVGEEDLVTQAFVSNQPTLGSLFKSQNGSTWDPSQWEDLKFTLYKANFVDQGNVLFYNPDLSFGNGQIPILEPDSINTVSKTVKLGLDQSLFDQSIQFGNKVIQVGTQASGIYVGNAGIATGELNIINAGAGYIPASGSTTYNDVPLTSISSDGESATADITIQNGVVSAATIRNSGIGYSTGDVLGIDITGSSPIEVGAGAQLSIAGVGNTNQIILENVQGDFVVSAGFANTVQYIQSGITSDINGDTAQVQVTEINEINDGLHFTVDHKNHGMYFNDNVVRLYGIAPDCIPTKTSAAIDTSESVEILIDNTNFNVVENFGTFENINVSASNPGYALIGKEIISYTSVLNDRLQGLTRGIDNSNKVEHSAGSKIVKYELSGVSLRRLNKIHNLEDVDANIEEPITFDRYTVKVDMTSSGVDRTQEQSTNLPNLFFNQTKSTGGSVIRATQNIPYEIVTPMVQNLTVPGTSITGQIRTVTGQGLSGEEIAWRDNGFESITLNESNYLKSTRLVASNVNGDDKLQTLPGNKSFILNINLNTDNRSLTPMIDLQRVNAIFTSNRNKSTNYRLCK